MSGNCFWDNFKINRAREKNRKKKGGGEWYYFPTQTIFFYSWIIRDIVLKAITFCFTVEGFNTVNFYL